MCFFPLIGAIIGGLSWMWGYWGIRLVNSRTFYAVALLLIPVMVTGGIHLDGLLDTSDALHSYQSRERKLEILKDSHAGAFAILTAVVYFLAYLGIYHELTLTGLPVVCIGFVLSRALAGFSIAAFPMAKNTGLAGAENLCESGFYFLCSCLYRPDAVVQPGHRGLRRAGSCFGISVLL